MGPWPQGTLFEISTQKTLCPLSLEGLQGGMEQGKNQQPRSRIFEWLGRTRECGLCIYCGLIPKMFFLCLRGGLDCWFALSACGEPLCLVPAGSLLSFLTFAQGRLGNWFPTPLFQWEE